MNNPQRVGIMFTYSITLQKSLGYVFTQGAYIETVMVSMERCWRYTKIIEEKPSVLDSDENLKINKWPTTGKIKFDKYSVKYRPDTETVWKDISFEINSKEKIGIVGRTGSGKSTICLCLFRILEPLTGTIYIDDVDIQEMGLDILRQNITIIPQDPCLMKGTLKYNIDPFDKYKNDEIMKVLKDIGFEVKVEENENKFELLEKENEDKFGILNKEIEQNGNNLSVGEKQWVCIARAILRNTKIVVMDEATANIDMKTEEWIQKAFFILLQKSTIITIAHRIKTIINYDRILVLNDGRIEEYDTPSNLLRNQNSLFSELYSKSII